MTLKLTNNVTKKEYEFNVEDKNDSRLYYSFEVELEDEMDAGEYDYQLYDDDEIVAHGLCQIGFYTNNNVIYTGNTHTYTQYNSN